MRRSKVTPTRMYPKGRQADHYAMPGEPMPDVEPPGKLTGHNPRSTGKHPKVSTGMLRNKINRTGKGGDVASGKA